MSALPPIANKVIKLDPNKPIAMQRELDGYAADGFKVVAVCQYPAGQQIMVFLTRG